MEQDRNQGKIRVRNLGALIPDRPSFVPPEDQLQQRDRGILLVIYFCENCNMVLDIGDPEVQLHKTDKPLHKMRRVQVVRCAKCGQIVTDSYAQYSQERGQFWCKNCVHGQVTAFHMP